MTCNEQSEKVAKFHGEPNQDNQTYIANSDYHSINSHCDGRTRIFSFNVLTYYRYSYGTVSLVSTEEIPVSYNILLKNSESLNKSSCKSSFCEKKPKQMVFLFLFCYTIG